MVVIRGIAAEKKANFASQTIQEITETKQPQDVESSTGLLFIIRDWTKPPNHGDMSHRLF